MLVSQRYGRGVSIALPIQDSYLWQMDPNAADADISFQTFWRQVLRWLTADVPGQLQLSIPTDQVMPGQPATIRAMVADTLYAPRNDARVLMHVAGTTASPARDIPCRVVDRDGEYHASFTPASTGLQVVRVDATAPNGQVLRDSIVVRVGDMNAEYVDAEMRAPLLKRIADETGGKFYRPGRTSTLVEDARCRRTRDGGNDGPWAAAGDLSPLVLLLTADGAIARRGSHDAAASRHRAVVQRCRVSAGAQTRRSSSLVGERGKSIGIHVPWRPAGNGASRQILPSRQQHCLAGRDSTMPPRRRGGIGTFDGEEYPRRINHMAAGTKPGDQILIVLIQPRQRRGGGCENSAFRLIDARSRQFSIDWRNVLPFSTSRLRAAMPSRHSRGQTASLSRRRNSAHERNESQFARFFVDALNRPGIAASTRTSRLSLLEPATPRPRRVDPIRTN
jgi:hypothetical protein